MSYGQVKLTDDDRRARARYDRLYPENRPTYIGDILCELGDIKRLLMELKEKKGTQP